jgi:hypothetical protein
MGRFIVCLISTGGSAMLLLQRLGSKSVLVLKKQFQLKTVDYVMILTAIVVMVYMSAMFQSAASAIGVGAP